MTPERGKLSTTFAFGSISNDPDGVITSTVWYFGDGSNLTQGNATHRYSSAGNYTVRFMVTDNSGNSVNYSLNVEVYLTMNIRPLANFTIEPLEGNLTTVFRFSSQCSDADGYIVSFMWDFGDGLHGSGENVSHATGHR
jgi:PKD repeat protein